MKYHTMKVIKGDVMSVVTSLFIYRDIVREFVHSINPFYIH